MAVRVARHPVVVVFDVEVVTYDVELFVVNRVNLPVLVVKLV